MIMFLSRGRVGRGGKRAECIRGARARSGPGIDSAPIPGVALVVLVEADDPAELGEGNEAVEIVT